MKIREIFKNKTFRLALIGAAALLLLLLIYFVFFRPSAPSAYEATEQERRLSVLLEEIEGVKSATVMITEQEGKPVSAVVIFKGEDGILLRTRLMEVAASALSLRTRDILVYPAGK